MADEIDRKGQYERVEQDSFYADHMKFVRHIKKFNAIYDVIGAIGLAVTGVGDYLVMRDGNLLNILASGLFTAMFAGALLSFRRDNRKTLSLLEKLADEIRNKENCKDIFEE